MLENESIKSSLLLQLLNELEAELCRLQLWQVDKPNIEALSSVVPFALDTLSFPQWLQFIFIDKLTQLLKLSLPLPKSISVLPMAEEYFKSQSIDSIKIVHIIAHIDRLLSEKE